MSYATPAQLREIAHEAEDGQEADTLFESLIGRASRAFDISAGKPEGYFEAAAELGDGEDGLEERVFYGDGTGFLKLPPYVSLDSISVPSGYTAPTYVEQGGYLVATSSGIVTAHVGGFYSGVPITVSARWGFEATPADVVQAVLEWAIKMWRTSDPVKAKIAVLEGQTYIGDAPAYTKLVASGWRGKGKVAFA